MVWRRIYFIRAVNAVRRNARRGTFHTAHFFCADARRNRDLFFWRENLKTSRRAVCLIAFGNSDSADYL